MKSGFLKTNWFFGLVAAPVMLLSNYSVFATHSPLHQSVDTFFTRAIEKEPDNRYQSGERFLAADWISAAKAGT